MKSKDVFHPAIGRAANVTGRSAALFPWKAVAELIWKCKMVRGLLLQCSCVAYEMCKSTRTWMHRDVQQHKVLGSNRVATKLWSVDNMRHGSVNVCVGNLGV